MTTFELTVDTSLNAVIERIIKEKAGESTPTQITRNGSVFTIEVNAIIPNDILLEIRDEILKILKSQRYIGSFKVV